MINHFTRAPHVEGAGPVLSSAPNAALLIDFDNVTMGIRSDLSKEIKTLLNSDIIKGKVTVQRAYADWRRYPQYIVPLSEASVDLIFAPAYGSSKKNATDIRMAIDGMELVFIRPEIGTYILLTGDSDFSSLVLKLKEYGKYVIGVGIQESSSDILVQNCDEYYSYSSIAGLQKASVGDKGKSVDPWHLVSEASKKMIERGDVMRSDRLKQVMLEMSPGFEESRFGFSKFSRFLAEAAARGLVRLRKLENGQHEILAAGGRQRDAATTRAPQHPGARSRASGPGGPERGRAAAAPGEAESPKREPRRESASGNGTTGADPLADAYELLRRGLAEISPDNSWTRDSDVKRRMLDLDRNFDETGLGFSKFSKFLTQAHEHDIVRIRRNEAGNFVVRLPRSHRARGGDASSAGSREESGTPAGADGAASGLSPTAAAGAPAAAPEAGAGDSASAVVDEAAPAESAEATASPAPKKGGRRTPRSPRQRMWRQSQRARERDRDERAGEDERADTKPAFDPARLGLPTDSSAVQRYLANRYRGVGEKTAERLIEAFGDRVFHVLHDSLDKVNGVLPRNRAAKLAEAWQDDFSRRSRAESKADRQATATARRTRLGRRRGSS
ncbi:MAG: NYN domain-containing protein [Gammaproteobacteria bacterium]|nr:NYN domain-containing protein [Gammaproteobacteria bacterium]MYF61731.1 NYN domain-containing protein [Gammaproteobacteria bacterium]